MAETSALKITGIGAQGDGIADDNGREVHVAGALTGETVRIEPDGSFVQLAEPSPDRRAHMLCPHFARCGGCSVQHMGDDFYKRWKGGLLGTALAQRGIEIEPRPMRSVPGGSRRRATFACQWTDGAAKLGFHGARSHDVEVITKCAVLRPEIVSALGPLGRIATALLMPGAAGRISVLAADSGLDVGIEGPTTGTGRRDQSGLARIAADARIIRLTVGAEAKFMLAKPVIRIAGIEVAPPAGAFLQAASEAETLLADLVLEGVGKVRKVADLFAGLGTLSLALAKRARVLAVDAEQPLLAALGAAVQNTQGLKPVERLKRDLFRDPMSPRELAAFDAVVLDPPRAGAAAQTAALARSTVKRVVMASCQPATLARDLRTLIDGGYVLERVTPIDQFLYSSHLEAVAVLSRK
jgi:23S rRNA (uracil1939-C5)-methyltransferase